MREQYLTIGDGTEDELDSLETNELDESIIEPFDPALIRVSTQAMTLDLLLNRIQHGELTLTPDFQRKAGIWGITQQSRLIESVLIRIPLPAFYMDATDDNKWLVIDGLQRLSTLKAFVLDQNLRLKDLEFLTQLNRKKFDELPRSYQRRISETQVTVYTIEPGTPEEVKFNIFKRINTGGLPLSSQEIRHALNQGQVTELLKKLSTSLSFFEATQGSVNNDRMADRELVLRFLAFHIFPYNQSKTKDLDSFLIETMRLINQIPTNLISSLEKDFERAMNISFQLFGEQAFRKFSSNGRITPINKALFETLSVNLQTLEDHEVELLLKHKDEFKHQFKALLRDSEFDSAISMGTGSATKIKTRFSKMQSFIADFLLICDI